MPFFHGTTLARLPSILAHGLGGIDAGPVSEECERGVYLASDPRLSVMVLVMHYANVGEPDSAPRDELAAMRVLVVDDARVDRALLVPDPQVRRWTGSWLYRGFIDVRGMPVLTVDEVMAGSLSLPPNDWAAVDGEGA